MALFKYLRPKFMRQYCTVAKIKNEAIDWDYYSNPSNFVEIATNLLVRNVECDMTAVLNQLKELNNVIKEPEKATAIKDHLAPIIYWFPNLTHPSVLQNKSGEPLKIGKVGNKPHFSYHPASFDSLVKRLNLLRTRYLGHITGNKSYYLKSDLALLEQSLIKYAVSKLKNKGFQLVSVPDILLKGYFEKCGFKTDSIHSQIYNIENDWAPEACLSGTSEMALAAFHAGKTINISDLPLKFCAVSRCYRAEANRHQTEKGIFRVHQFTKVEMFGITANETGKESEELFDELTTIQKEIFSDWGLPFLILDMPASDLGLPAYRKIDIEAWMPNRKMHGEISSTSNCTDYQSRRMDIKYALPSGKVKFCHTVNGTAGAIPRLLISIFENNQNYDGSISIPDSLQQLMKKEIIRDQFSERMLSKKPVG